MAITQTGTILRQIDQLFGVGTVAGLSDAQLLGRFRAQRDEAAFVALVTRHGPMVLAVCRGVLREEHAAEDAFQATFLILVRKAGVLWVGDSLGGWLHRVAHRVALQARADAARRRLREKRAGEAAALKQVQEEPQDDALRAFLHAEIARLPDRLRLPVVLCDLEGMTRDHAAARLGWSEGTVRGRLARARELLRQRLTRRGAVIPAGALAATLGREAIAAPVSDPLLTATIRAAAGQGTTAVAVALAARVMQALLAAKLKAGAAIVLGVAALVSIGWFLAARGPEAEKPMATPLPAPGAAATHEDEQGAAAEVHGRVVDPGGRPVAGATLRTAYLDTDDRRIPETTSGPEGRFFMRIPRVIRNAAMLNGGDTFPWVVGSAPGFGPGWAPGAFKAAASGELTVRLVEDGPPLEGRLVDLEGRPVAGARVKVERIWFAVEQHPPRAESGDLAAWIARVKDRGAWNLWQGLGNLPGAITATTGLDGRFRLTGIGRERVAELLLSGPTIATTQLYVMTRDGPEVRWTVHFAGQATTNVLHAPRFEHAAAPTKPVEGVIRDKDTGLPIAGMTLHAAVYDERSLIPAQGIEAITDTRGSYCLSGLPRAPAYRLFVEAGENIPYPGAVFRVPADSPALDPVRFAITLKRGVVLRGRVTDKATCKPVPGYINVFAFRENPAVKEFPGYVLSDPPYVYIKDDGQYQAVALPGRNIVACRSHLRRYRGSVGADAIKGYDPEHMDFSSTLPLECYVRDYHVLAEVNIDAGAESATLDLQVDPGGTLIVNVVDPEGKSIGGTVAAGIGDLSPSIEYPQESSTIEIHALDPSKPRRVTVTHRGRKLIGSVYLKGNESGQLTLRLQPWGTITGRIIDDEGAPRGGMSLISAGGSSPMQPDVQGILPGGNWNGGIRIGRDGRFRVEGLVPGLKYGATASERDIVVGNLFQDVMVAPGEVKELGDLKVVPQKEDPS
jgi:RNA polymerase sigma factor (sigma-70 family)